MRVWVVSSMCVWLEIVARAFGVAYVPADGGFCQLDYAGRRWS